VHEELEVLKVEEQRREDEYAVQRRGKVSHRVKTYRMKTMRRSR
jgi:hypothetical protein